MKKILSVAVAVLLLGYGQGQAATGCNYPASHDAFANRIAGDFLTTALLNTIMCSVEQLEAGPLRPLDGTVSAPAWSFRDDANTGIYRNAANQFTFVTDGVMRGKFENQGLVVGTSGTARGNFNSQKGGSWFLHNSTTIAAGASINLEHATSGVGASDGILMVFAGSGAGNACIFVAGGGAGATAVIAGTTGVCQITDTGTNTIALIHDGDGTYTLKSRLSTDQLFHMTWLGL